MPAQNILSNLFTALYNNELRNKKECLVIPASKLASEVLRIIQKNKYIGEFELIDDGLGGKYKIQLLGRINKCGLISPRLAIQKHEYERWERNYLPAVGVGILVMTTSEGVLSHSDAKGKGIGGRLLGYVY